ncbi:MAG: hypothetical protein ACYDHX_16630 [Methanothrix sp.]|jgi:hypothetical protein
MDASLFIRELGIKSPMLKVLDFLIDNEVFDYSKTDIAEGAELSRATLFKVWPKLEALDLIIATRTVGQAKMYKLNKQNPIIKKLMELDDAISEYFALKHCDSEASSSNSELLKVVGPSRDLITAIVDYENDSHNDKRDKHEELLLV